jgi:hypothetical protein
LSVDKLTLKQTARVPRYALMLQRWSQNSAPSHCRACSSLFKDGVMSSNITVIHQMKGCDINRFYIPTVVHLQADVEDCDRVMAIVFSGVRLQTHFSGQLQGHFLTGQAMHTFMFFLLEDWGRHLITPASLHSPQKSQCECVINTIQSNEW